jgi:UDP-N-acetylmuramate dehydrogenase
MFEENVPLAAHSNYKIGGPARFFAEVKNVKEVVEAYKFAKENLASLPAGRQVFILGGGTNLLISDKGFDGLVIKAAFPHVEKRSEELLAVGAGVLVKDLLEFMGLHSLSGLEWAGGLPGTVGGAIWGNAGAFGGEMKDSVVEVVSVDISSGASRVITRTNDECQFGYRSSIFKENSNRGIKEVIAEVVFKVSKGDQRAIRKVIQEKVDYRKARQPLDYPNVGSIFKNVDIKMVPAATLEKFKEKIKTDPFPVLPTAVLINAAGLTGRAIGGAMVSPKHANFIINATGEATAADVKALMEIVKNEVKNQFGVEIEQEVIFV